MNTVIRIGSYALATYVGYGVATINDRFDTVKRTAYGRMKVQDDSSESIVTVSTALPYAHLLELDDKKLRQAVAAMSKASEEELAVYADSRT